MRRSSIQAYIVSADTTRPYNGDFRVRIGHQACLDRAATGLFDGQLRFHTQGLRPNEYAGAPVIEFEVRDDEAYRQAVKRLFGDRVAAELYEECAPGEAVSFIVSSDEAYDIVERLARAAGVGILLDA